MSHTDPQSSSGCSRLPDAAWAAVRDDYAQGHAAPDVCARHGVPLSTFRDRARREGWRRSDLDEDRPAPTWDDRLDDAEVCTDPRVMADQAWRNAAVAITRGDRVAARAWTRLAADLRAVAVAAIDAAQSEQIAETSQAEWEIREAGGEPTPFSVAVEQLERAQRPSDPERRWRQAVANVVRLKSVRRSVRPPLLIPLGELDDLDVSHPENASGAGGAAATAGDLLASASPAVLAASDGP